MPRSPTPVVFLHGFAATARHWERVIAALPARFVPLALNLAEADPMTPEGVTKLVGDCAAERVVLVGYSMGGRLALHAALAIGERIERLVLVSTGAGIENAAERAARRAADEALAAQIETSSISSFVERWAALPLFANDPDWVRREVAADELRCTPAALAACLRNLGSGAMAPMWGRLHELRMPVAVIAGADDEAYASIGRRLADGIGDSTFTAVPGVAHRVALQAPAAVVEALEGA